MRREPRLNRSTDRVRVAVAVSVVARVTHLRQVEILDVGGAQRSGADRAFRERALRASILGGVAVPTRTPAQDARRLLPASGVRWLLPALPRFQAPFVVLVEHG